MPSAGVSDGSSLSLPGSVLTHALKLCNCDFVLARYVSGAAVGHLQTFDTLFEDEENAGDARGSQNSAHPATDQKYPHSLPQRYPRHDRRTQQQRHPTPSIRLWSPFTQTTGKWCLTCCRYQHIALLRSHLNNFSAHRVNNYLPFQAGEALHPAHHKSKRAGRCCCRLCAVGTPARR